MILWQGSKSNSCLNAYPNLNLCPKIFFRTLGHRFILYKAELKKALNHVIELHLSCNKIVEKILKKIFQQRKHLKVVNMYHGTAIDKYCDLIIFKCYSV